MLNSVHSAVCSSDNFVEDHESGLQGCEFDECLDGFRVHLLRPYHLLSTPAQSSQIEICKPPTEFVKGENGKLRSVRTSPWDPIDLKCGEYNSRYVFLFRFDFEGCRFCLFLYKIRDVSSRIGDLREREGGQLHDSAHLSFRLPDTRKSVQHTLKNSINERTSSTFFRIARNRVVKASRFFASSECPV